MKNKKDAKRKAQLEFRTKCESFRFNTTRRVAAKYAEITDAIPARLEMELQWIFKHNLMEGFGQLEEVMTIARSEFGMEPGVSDPFLNGSAVAYLLGLTPQDPIALGLQAAEFTQEDFQPRLNVRITVDAEKRSAFIARLEELFGKSMMRTGVPIFKLSGIILECQRTLK
jgi:hypothetical protein